MREATPEGSKYSYPVARGSAFSFRRADLMICASTSSLGASPVPASKITWKSCGLKDRDRMCLLSLTMLTPIHLGLEPVASWNRGA